MAWTEDPVRSFSAKIASEINAIVAILVDRWDEGLVCSVFSKTFGFVFFF